MMEKIQTWMEDAVRLFKPQAPVLEVGSFNVNGSVRQFFPEPYFGLDQRDGPGVDIVADIETYRGCDGTYNTVVTTETLEHIEAPWHAIERMSLCLQPGGLLFVTVPWMFGMHDYPRDCWRILPDGLAVLFHRAGIDTAFMKADDTHTYAVGRRV